LYDRSWAASLVVDDAGEKEWEVETICDYRAGDDGDLELLVRWKGGEETWEPYENVAERRHLTSTSTFMAGLCRYCLKYYLSDLFSANSVRAISADQ
jgi:hypothetical protein